MAEESNVGLIKTLFVRLLRDNLFGGEELALLEPVNGPRPGKTHASIRFLSVEAQQHEITNYHGPAKPGDPDFSQKIKGEKYCKVRLTFFGVGAFQKAVEAQNLFRSSQRQFDMFAYIGFGHVGEVSDIPEEYLGRIEERATMVIEFYALIPATYNADYVETVSGEIIREGAPIPFEVTLIK